MHKVSLVAASVAALLASVPALSQGSDDPLEYVVVTATRANQGVRASP